MSIIFDMTGGRIKSPPAENNTVAARDETIPALALREQLSSGRNEQLRADSIHLIRALINKG